MSRQLQNQFLNFIESGRIKVDEQRKRYDFAIKEVGSLPHVTKLTGYPNLCSPDSNISIFQILLRAISADRG